MNIPAPAPIGRAASIALAAPFGWIAPEQLALAKEAGRAPVIMHRLGGENARQQRGPREFREGTTAALERAGWTSPWGLGGVCRNPDDAAQFAVAGFTWFTFDLAEYLEPRAASMTLDELDAAIVSLEDRGIFPINWHERYLLNGPVGPAPSFTDEVLARAAVRFGPALQEAEQMAQAIRASSSERGDLPDLEFSFRHAGAAMTAKELAFVTLEAAHRGLIHGGVSRFEPALGTWHEPGGEGPAQAPEIVLHLADVCLPPALISLPEPVGRLVAARPSHWSAEPASILAWFRRLATAQPAFFREWLAAARDAFPVAKAGWQISTGEDAIRSLPEVGDAALAPTFLDTVQGRQLLLVTWQDVADELGSKVPPLDPVG